MKTEILHTFSSAISVFMETKILQKSFWRRSFEEDKKDIENIFNDLDERKILALNSSLHSSEIKIFEAKDVKKWFTILPWWIDGIIIKNIWKNDEKIHLLACFADCGGVCFSSKNWDFIGLIHAGHKWVATGIIQKLCDFFGENTREKNDIEIFIAPMLGKYFEFERKLYEQNFSYILDSQWLSFEEYFCPIDELKGFLDLRGMIEDMFIKRGLQKEQIIFDKRETNNPQNNLPSYRLYTIYHNLQAKIKKNEKLTLLEKELRSSSFRDNYVEQKRILVGVGM